MALISGGASGGAVSSSTVTLTDAQIKALPSTAVEVVPAQGSNTIIAPLSAWLHMAWTADYTNIAATATVFFQHGTSNIGPLSEFSQAVGGQVGNLLADGASHYALAAPTQYLDTGAPLITIAPGQIDDDPGPVNVNLNLKARNAALGNFTGGNAGNALKVQVLYFVFAF